MTLSYTNEFEKGADECYEKIHVTNPTERLAFLVHLRLTRGPGGAEILSILWDDNYFEILPGETKDVTARFYTGELAGTSPEVEVSGWNVTSATPR